MTCQVRSQRSPVKPRLGCLEDRVMPQDRRRRDGDRIDGLPRHAAKGIGGGRDLIEKVDELLHGPHESPGEAAL